MSKRNRRVIHNINVTPFVDVMLVLLIIFMITSPMLVTGIDIDLPISSAGPIAVQDNPLVINIDRYGRPYINSVQITHSDLPKKLRAITREKYDTKILVRGDSGADYGKVIRVMGLITSAGFSKVMLETEPET